MNEWVQKRVFKRGFYALDDTNVDFMRFWVFLFIWLEGKNLHLFFGLGKLKLLSTKGEKEWGEA